VVKHYAKLDDPAVVPLLIAALDKDDYYIREMIIKELGKTGDPRCVPALEPFLDDSSYSIRSTRTSKTKSMPT